MSERHRAGPQGASPALAGRVLRKDISRAAFLMLQVPNLQPKVPFVETCKAVDTGLWLSVLLFPNSRPVMGWEGIKEVVL